MIGFVRDLLDELVLTPQTFPAMGERRVFLDPENRPIDVEAQEVDILGLTTAPIGFEIGGGMTLRHTISVLVDVQHGDQSEAVRLRDAIVLDLCLRAVAAGGDMAARVDPASGQYVTGSTWLVDYRPLSIDTPNESATIVFTIDTQLDR